MLGLIFYQLYSLLTKIEVKDTAYKAMMALAFHIYINIISLYIILNEITVKEIFIPRFLVILSFILIAGLLYLKFLYKNKYEDLIRNYESRGSATSKNSKIITLLFFSITIALFVVCIRM